LSDQNRNSTPASLPPDAAARLFALSHDLMGAIDRSGRLVWTNAAWEETLGWTPEELAEINYLELVHPDDHEQLLVAHSALVGGAPEWPPTELRVRARERRCDALVAAGRAEAAVGDLQHLVEFVRDENDAEALCRHAAECL
jgi:PAS domain S-box-containing protein